MKHFVLAALITLCSYASASADLFIKADDVSVLSSPTDPVDSFFDVFFQLEAPVPALPDLAGYQVRVDLSPSSAGVTLGTAQNPTAPHEPIFPAPPTDFGSTDQRIQAAQDVVVGAEATIVDGAGMIRVPFQVAAGTTGIFDVTLDAIATELSDGNANLITFTPRNGTITVDIPEPSSLVIIAAAFVSLTATRSRRLF